MRRYEALCALVHNLQYTRVIYREESRYEIFVFKSPTERHYDVLCARRSVQPFNRDVLSHLHIEERFFSAIDTPKTQFASRESRGESTFVFSRAMLRN